ncbi:MAG: hypothetical protein FWE76_03395 [Symbiobacteriaceae bacterium]|nr:hypothetical protein [Symbiobacteriaceae bacterium]
MREDILAMILVAEDEYQQALVEAEREAELYISERRREQNAYLEKLLQEWEQFEENENLRLQAMLSEDERQLNEETRLARERLLARQQEVAELISERLKQEVLAAYGNR